MNSVKCSFYNVFLIIVLFFPCIFVVVMKVLEWTANRICACVRFVFMFFKTYTAIKQRTKQTIIVTIQGNNTEPVTSKRPESCRVKTTSLLKNKKPFKEKEISTKVETNSVRFPVPFICNNQTRTEGRVPRNHDFRRTGQVATGMTNSLRTLYFDFQNKDENSYKQGKRNDKIKVGAKLRPNQYGGHIHERKIVVPKTVLNSIGNYQELDCYDQNKNTICDLTDHYKQLNQKTQITKPQGNHSPTSILKTLPVRLWSVDVNAATKNPAIHQRQDCCNSTKTEESSPETGTKISNNNTVQQANCENRKGTNNLKVPFNSILIAASKTMTNFLHDARKSSCIYSSWQVERNQKVSLIFMDMANTVVNIVRNGCFRFVYAQLRNIKNSHKMLARNSMIVISATRGAVLNTIRVQATLKHSIQRHAKVIRDVMTRVGKTGRLICSTFTSGIRVLRSSVATSTLHIHEAVSQLITITSPQMACASSIITNVQQDDKSTDDNVVHQVESSTAPKDGQNCVGKLSTVRAGCISSTSKQVRYSKYSNIKNNPVIKPGSQSSSKCLHSHTNESFQCNNNKQKSRSAVKKVQLSTSSNTGQRLYLPELNRKHPRMPSKGKLKDCKPLLSMLPSNGDESSKVAVNRTKKQNKVIPAACRDTPSSTISATCTDTPVSVILATSTGALTSGVTSAACADTPASTPTVTCIPPSQVNTVANGKDIRTTLSSVNVNAESEVIKACISVNRHSLEIQSAEDLPFSRGKRPHIEKERTSVDGQTPASFISQFKFNTAVPNMYTTTGIKEPHPLELRNTNFASLSSAGKNIIGSDTGSSFKNVQTRLQSILTISHLAQGGSETQPEPMEVGESVEKPFTITKPEAMEVNYGPCPMTGDSCIVQVPSTNSAEKQKIEEMETEQEHSSVWSFFPFSLPSFPVSPFKIPSAVEKMELDEQLQSVHVTELEEMEVSEEVFPMTTPFGQHEKAKWSTSPTGIERSVTCPLPQQVTLGFRPFASPHGETVETKRPLASRLGVFGETAFSLKTASAEQRIMQPGTLQQVPYAATPSVMQPVMQRLNAQTAMQPANQAVMQSKVQVVTQPVVVSTTQALTQQMSQPVMQSYMVPVVQTVRQTETQPKSQQVAQLAKQLSPEANKLDKDTSEQQGADRELTSTPEALLANELDEQLQLVPSTDAAYLDTVSDSESEFDSDDEFELDLETIEKFSYLESSPDHARLIAKIMNEKESTQWHSVSDLHSNGHNLEDKHGLSEMLDLNVIERYSELEDEIERSPEYAHHLAKLLAEKESLSELCHM